VASQNRKGIFTRERQPKPAAYQLKERYKKLGLKLQKIRDGSLFSMKDSDEGDVETSASKFTTCTHSPHSFEINVNT